MLEEFKEEEIVKKVGGRFKLSSLIQKRFVALNRGARPLIELPSKNTMEIVVAEIMNDKIYLDASGEVAVAATAAHLRKSFRMMPAQRSMICKLKA